MISIHAAFSGQTTRPSFQKSCQTVLLMSTTVNSRLCKQKNTFVLDYTEHTVQMLHPNIKKISPCRDL